MKNKNLLILGAVIFGGIYLWKRNQEKARQASLENDDTNMSNCSGCGEHSNLIGIKNVKGGGHTCNFNIGGASYAIRCGQSDFVHGEHWTASCDPNSGICTATSASGSVIQGTKSGGTLSAQLGLR